MVRRRNRRNINLRGGERRLRGAARRDKDDLSPDAGVMERFSSIAGR